MPALLLAMDQDPAPREPVICPFSSFSIPASSALEDATKTPFPVGPLSSHSTRVLAMILSISLFLISPFPIVAKSGLYRPI
ncbi:hypothetical protein BDN72DRAFT_906789 [Pluteus cervinus]|uniref:Uncharacterized protein n=1 Tax=Pluteus cervinus TaxID=181527 RepID=A0ACD2ZY75_9AGAR|nr:hypothetical protein BDN72DRAFT_906789 [Pluteus cervinus]